MLGAQRLKQQFLLRYLSNRRFGASVIIGIKYACNTCIELTELCFSETWGSSWSAKHCTTFYCHSEVPTPQLHGLNGSQRLLEQRQVIAIAFMYRLLKYSNQRTIF